MSKGGKSPSVDSLQNFGVFKNRRLRWIENNTHYFLILICTVVGFFFRILISMRIEGILHPDEVYQSFEMAHKIVFGSAIVPPEFQTEWADPPSYASSRSWTFPLFFAFFMKLFSILGLNYFDHTLPFIRFILAVNSTFLIYSVRKVAFQITKSQNVELFATVYIAFWFRIVAYTVRSFNNTFFLPILFYAIYRVLVSLETGKIRSSDHMFAIVGMGIASYNRMDLLLIIFVFFMMTLHKRNLEKYIQFSIDGLLGWGIGIVIDSYYFGGFRIPPKNWFQFNLVENYADVFGLSSWSYYIDEVIVADGLLSFVKLTLVILLIAGSVIYVDKKMLYTGNEVLLRSFFKQFLMVSFVWLIYTSFWREISFGSLGHFLVTGESWHPMSHKEVRFIMGGLVLLLVFLSTGLQVGIIMVLKFVNWTFLKLQKQPNTENEVKANLDLQIEISHWINVLLTFVLMLLIINQSMAYAELRQPIEQFADIDQALVYIGKQGDAFGVIVGVKWFQAGSYTYSHLNSTTPIVFLNFQGADPSAYNLNRALSDIYLSNGKYNYFLAPDYQFDAYPELTDSLLNNGWQLDWIVYGKVFIWKLQ